MCFLCFLEVFMKHWYINDVIKHYTWTSAPAHVYLHLQTRTNNCCKPANLKKKKKNSLLWGAAETDSETMQLFWNYCRLWWMWKVIETSSNFCFLGKSVSYKLKDSRQLFHRKKLKTSSFQLRFYPPAVLSVNTRSKSMNIYIFCLQYN